MGFELLKTGNGGAAGAGDFITQGGGMLACLENHLRGTGDGLSGEGERGGARQAHEDATVREGLDANTLRDAWEKKEHAEIEQFVVAIKQALPTAPIEEAGERATMPYGSGSIQLVREHGLWKIENLE